MREGSVIELRAASSARHRSPFGRTRVTLVCVLAVAFAASCSTLDIVRPTLTLAEDYLVDLVDFLLLFALALLLFRSDRGPPTALMPPDRRIATKGADPLLTIRCFACVMVLVGHYFVIVFPPAPVETLMVSTPWYWLLASSPWAGLWIFFVLSAYLMGKGFWSGRYPLDPGGLARFYRNRWLRIYPVYALAIVVVAVFRTPHLVSVDQGYVVLNMLLFNSAAPAGPKPIYALWSISVEFQFYLLAPFFAMLIDWTARFVRPVVLLAIVLAAGAASRYVAVRHLGWPWPTTVYFPFVWNLDLFLSGMILARIVGEARQAGLRLKVPPAAILALFPVFYLSISYAGSLTVFRSIDGTVYVSLWPFLSAIFTCAAIFAFEGADMARALRAAPVSRRIVQATQPIGILTFCIYVWHEPILLSIRSNFGPDLGMWNTLVLFGPVMMLCLAFAVTFYSLVERPFEQVRAGRAALPTEEPDRAAEQLGRGRPTTARPARSIGL